MRVFTNPTSPAPEVHLLSNGRYHVVISSAGGGYSRWRDLAVTRWREDATRDCWGMFVYLRDVGTGEFWSTAYQPTLQMTKGYEAIFTQARAEFRHRHAGLEVHTEISVSPEDDVELRRITITNRSPRDARHRTDQLRRGGARVAGGGRGASGVQQSLRANRIRAKIFRHSLHAPRPFPGRKAAVVAASDAWARAAIREKFPAKRIAPNLSVAAAAWPIRRRCRRISPLSNTVGSVLDPIISLRRTVTLPPHETATIDLVVGVTESRETALAQVEKYQSSRMADRVFDLAWTHSQVTLRQLNATEAEAQLYGRLASALIYADPARRAHSGVLLNNRRGQNGLWSYGISGDLPIVLLRISDTEKIEIVRQLIQAHSYWRMKGLTVDLVILNEDVSVYRQSLQDQITTLDFFRHRGANARQAGRHFRPATRTNSQRRPRAAAIGGAHCPR